MRACPVEGWGTGWGLSMPDSAFTAKAIPLSREYSFSVPFRNKPVLAPEQAEGHKDEHGLGPVRQ